MVVEHHSMQLVNKRMHQHSVLLFGFLFDKDSLQPIQHKDLLTYTHTHNMAWDANTCTRLTSQHTNPARIIELIVIDK